MHGRHGPERESEAAAALKFEADARVRRHACDRLAHNACALRLGGIF
jgi:hypothetical protein